MTSDWFEGQPYIWYRLIDGPDTGRYVYVAEEINRLARIGTQLSAGQPVAYFTNSGTCIEMGWGTPGWQTLAQATTGYYEGERTLAGMSFAHFLISRGVHGPFELSPTHGRMTRVATIMEAPASPPPARTTRHSAGLKTP
jgi:hypothetical protein